MRHSINIKLGKSEKKSSFPSSFNFWIKFATIMGNFFVEGHGEDRQEFGHSHRAV